MAAYLDAGPQTEIAVGEIVGGGVGGNAGEVIVGVGILSEEGQPCVRGGGGTGQPVEGIVAVVCLGGGAVPGLQRDRPAGGQPASTKLSPASPLTVTVWDSRRVAVGKPVSL